MEVHTTSRTKRGAHPAFRIATSRTTETPFFHDPEVETGRGEQLGSAAPPAFAEVQQGRRGVERALDWGQDLVAAAEAVDENHRAKLASTPILTSASVVLEPREIPRGAAVYDARGASAYPS